MTLLHEVEVRPGAGSRLAGRAVLVMAGSALLTLAAKFQVPFYPVPLSMLSFVAIGLGPACGIAAVLLYFLQGPAGLPVFAGTPAHGLGLPYMLGPTGGYPGGYGVQAGVAGLLTRHGRVGFDRATLVAALAASAAVYPTGLLWLGVVHGFGKPLLALGLYPFVIGDLLKAVLADLVFPLARASFVADRRI